MIGLDRRARRGRRWWPLVGVVILVVTLVAAAGPFEAPSPGASPPMTTTAAPVEPPAPADAGPIDLSEPAPIGDGGPIDGGAGQRVAVASVTDGDTLVLVDGRRVRLAQVDAPEIPGDCYGHDATDHLRQLVDGAEVVLRRPSTAPAVDRYGRTVAEVLVVRDGGLTSANEALLRVGAAGFSSRFADEDRDLAGRLRAAEAEARAAGRGLWSACRPSGAAPAPASTVPASGTCHPAYTPCLPPAPPDLDCADIGTRVQVDHRHGDPHRLDGTDRDGWGCETYP